MIECTDCEKRFHAKCSNLEADDLLKTEIGNSDWYCTNCKADCGMCSGAVLSVHKAIQCDGARCGFTMNAFITEAEFENLVVHGFVQNVNVSTFQTLSLLIN